LQPRFDVRHPALAVVSTVILAGLVGVATLAFAAAQQQKPAAPAAAPAEISPAALDLAKEVVQSSGVARSFETLIPQFLEQARASLGTTRPEIAKDLGEVITQIRPEFDKQRDDMLNLAARVFAKRLTEPELKDIATFFKSASGQKYVSTQPLMLDELFGEMRTWTRALSEQIVVRIRAEMKKRGHDICSFGDLAAVSSPATRAAGWEGDPTSRSIHEICKVWIPFPALRAAGDDTRHSRQASDQSSSDRILRSVPRKNGATRATMRRV
jgi:hypothetical protein